MKKVVEIKLIIMKIMHLLKIYFSVHINIISRESADTNLCSLSEMQ